MPLSRAKSQARERAGKRNSRRSVNVMLSVVSERKEGWQIANWTQKQLDALVHRHIQLRTELTRAVNELRRLKYCDDRYEQARFELSQARSELREIRDRYNRNLLRRRKHGLSASDRR